MKKKMFARSTALVLAIFLTLSFALTGCGKEKKEATSNSTKTTVVEDKTPKKISVSLYDRGNVPASEGTADNNQWTKWVKESMLKDYNVIVNYVLVPRWESIQKFNLLFAAGEAPDLIYEYIAAYRGQLYNNKQIQPYDEALKKSVEYKGIMDQYPSMKKLATRPDGKMYELVKSNSAKANHALFIRNDWLKALNLTVPKTADDLYKAAKAFGEQDPDKNGQKDTQGIALSFISGMFIDAAFANTGFTADKGGKIVYNLEQFKAATEFKKKLYDEGLVSKDYALDKNGAKAKEDFIKGKVGIYGESAVNMYGVSTSTSAIEILLQKNVPTADVVPVPVLDTPFGANGPTIGLPIQPIGVINATCKNVDAIIKYQDFMSKESTYIKLRVGEEGVWTAKNALGVLIDIPEKAKDKSVQMAYTPDLAMPTHITSYKFGKDIDRLNPSKPDEKRVIDMTNTMQNYYFDVNKPMAGLTHGELAPTLPEALVPSNNVLFKGVEGKKDELQTKAVIGGSKYGVADAVKEWNASWTANSGDKLLEFYQKWYDENKSTMLTWKDIYTTK